MYGSRSRSARLGVSVVRGRLPGASVAGRPGVRVNICARVPRQKPRPGMIGEDCSQPPLGVADTMLPNRSATSRWQVSPARWLEAAGPGGLRVCEPGPMVCEPGPLVREPGPLVREPGPLVCEPGPLVREPGPLVRI